MSRILSTASLAVIMASLSVSGCMKGSKSANDARGGGKFKATPGEIKASYAPNYTLETPIKFTITTLEGRPIPNVLTDFRAFDVTASHQAGISDANLRAEMIAKWNDGNFIMNPNGVIDGSKCDAGFTREACVGILSGASSTTNQNGEASVGFSTPNSPGAVIAIAVKVPESSNAADLVEFVKIKLTTNEEFANSGISPIQSVLLVIPLLFDKDGNQVVKSGSTFNLALYAPGVPNTEAGKGFSFTFTTTGSGDILASDGTIVPNGALSCEFRNSQCIVPGGPFKVMKPGSVKFETRPSDPKFPVKPAALSVTSTIGEAQELMLSLTDASKGVTPACVNKTDISRACFIMTAGKDVTVYPMLVDAGRNFVAYVDTEITPQTANDALKIEQIVRSGNSIKLSPTEAGAGFINIRRTDSVSSAPQETMRYEILPGEPARIEVLSERATATSSTEQATRDFATKITILDRHNNICVGLTADLAIELTLEGSSAGSPPLAAQFPAGLFPDNYQLPPTVSAVNLVDHTSTPVQIINGIGVTTQKFRVEKAPQIVRIRVGQHALNIPGSRTYNNLEQLNNANSTINIIAGPAKFALLRKAPGGIGAVWKSETPSEDAPELGIRIRSDQEHFFYNAAYDAAGNYTGEDVPSKFFGVDYRMSGVWTDSTTTAQLSFIRQSSTTDLGKYSSLVSVNAPDDNGCPEPSPSANPNVDPALDEFPNNMPPRSHATVQGFIYCGLHLGLTKKSGRDTSFRSTGIGGTGRILAVPDNPEIEPAITPRLTLAAGVATKYAFEYRDPDTGAIISTARKNLAEYKRPIPAGQEFRIHLLALDSEGNVAESHTGEKTFTIVSSANESWGALKPITPNATTTSDKCYFPEYNPGETIPPGVTLSQQEQEARTLGVPKGHCLFKSVAIVDGNLVTSPARYRLVDVRQQTLISIKETTANAAMPGLHADLIEVTAGPPKRLYFSDKKGISLTDRGGPQSGALPQIQVTVQAGKVVKVGKSVQPWAIAVADEWGNWLQDANMDDIEITGFDSTLNSLEGVFNQITGTPAPVFTESELFTEKRDSDDNIITRAKFYRTDIPAQLSEIASAEKRLLTSSSEYSEEFRDSFLDQYQIAYVPQNRTGKGFAIARYKPVAAESLLAGETYEITDVGNTAWAAVGALGENTVGQQFKATGPGAGTGRARKVAIGWPSPYLDVRPGEAEHIETKLMAGNGFNGEAANMSIKASQVCNTVVISIHDAKHNIIDYSGSVMGAFKLFNSNADDPYAFDTANPESYSFSVLTQQATKNYYETVNKPLSVGPFNDAFEILTAGETDGGGALWSTASGAITEKAPLKNFWAGTVNISAGKVTLPGRICLYNGQKIVNGVLASGVEKFFQVDLAPDSNPERFKGLTSRGEGIRYKGANNTTVGSTLSGTELAHQDLVTFQVSPNTVDHLHPTFDDSNPTYAHIPNENELKKKIVPQLNISDPNTSIVVVDEPCPAWHCGETQVYWHSHDSAHNYLGPASTAGFTIDSSTVPAAVDRDANSNIITGPNGAPRITIFPSGTSRTLAESLTGNYNIRVRNNQNVFNTGAVGHSFRSGFNFPVLPGPPKKLTAQQIISGIQSTDTPFGIYWGLLDQYDNPAGSGGFEAYSGDTTRNMTVGRTSKIYWNLLGSQTEPPSNAPLAAAVNPIDDHKPKLMGSRLSHGTVGTAITKVHTANNNQRNFAVSQSATIDNQQSILVRSDEDIEIRIDVIDNNEVTWCKDNRQACCINIVNDECQDEAGAKTFKLNPPLRLKALAGSPTSVAITNRSDFTAKDYITANFTSIFSSAGGPKDIYPLGPDPERIITSYACDKDQYGNIGDCLRNATFSLADITGGPSVASAVGDTDNVNVFRWKPAKPGSFKITATKDGRTFTSDTILVGAMPLAKLSISNFNPSHPVYTPDTSDDQTQLKIKAGRILEAKVCMTDQADNIITEPVIINNTTVTNPDADNVRLNFNALGVPFNLEGRNIEISKLGDTSFTSLPLGVDHEFDFNDGCTTIFVKVVAKGQYTSDILSVTHQDPIQLKNIVGQGLRVDEVEGEALDHFVTTAERLSQFPLINSTEAWATPGTTLNPQDYAEQGGNRFDLTIYPRDQYGNSIEVSNLSVNLGLRDGQGPIANRFPLCPPGQTAPDCLTRNLSGDQLKIEGLALDLGGQGVYINATATTGGGAKGISPQFSTFINPRSSLKTIKRYNIGSPASTLIQPALTSVTVTAVDAGNLPIIGIQDALNNPSLGFTWQIAFEDGSSYQPNTSRCSAVLPRPQFVQSSATVTTMALARSGRVRINIQDNQSTPASSSNSSITAINSAAGKPTFELTCLTNPGNQPCNGTEAAPFEIQGSPASQFDLTLSAFDTCRNPVPLPISASIKLETFRPEDFGALVSQNTGILESLNPIPVDGLEQLRVIRDSSNQQSKAITNLFHRSSNHNIKYTIDQNSIDYETMLQSVYHKYTSAPGTVYAYVLQPIAPTTDWETAVAGVPVKFRMRAVDVVGQRVYGADTDTHLNARQFTWSGPSKAPNNEDPILPTSISFTNGETGDLSATFKKEESFNFKVTDDYSPGQLPGGRGPDGKRMSDSLGLTAVSQAAPDRFDMKLTTVVAVDGQNRHEITTGRGYDVEITAFDKYGNLATNIGSQELQFRWSNASNSNIPEDLIGTGGTANGKLAASQYTPKSPSDATFTFDPITAKYTSTGAQFSIYRSGEFPTLSVTAPSLLRQDNQAINKSLQFKPRSDGNTDYVRITDQPTYSSAADMTNRSISLQASQTKSFYAFGFDAYGNQIGSFTPAEWQDFDFNSGPGSEVLSTKLGPVTTFTGQKALAGYLEVNCTQDGQYPQCLKGKTGTITVSQGPLVGFAAVILSPSSMGAGGFTPQPTANAGEEIKFKLCMRDARDNLITSPVLAADGLATITDPEASLSIRINSNVQPSPEGQSIHLSTGSGEGFDAGILNLTDNQPELLDFTQGCTNLAAKVYGAKLYSNATLLSFAYDTIDHISNEPRIASGGALRTYEILPGQLDHYVTKAQNAATTPVINSAPGWSTPATETRHANDGGNRFDVLVYARDVYGNNTPITGSVNLSLVRGTNYADFPSSRNLHCDPAQAQYSCRTLTFSNSAEARVNKVAIDIGGQTFYVAANGGGKTTSYSWSELITAISTAKTIKNYTVTAPTSVEAGVEFIAEVAAKDAGNEDVIGADDILNEMTYTWLDGNSQPLENHSINGHQISAPTTFTGNSRFSSGRANARLTLVKAENELKILLKDENNTAATNSGQTNVSSGRRTFYSISCKTQQNDTDCSGSTEGVIDWHPFAASPSLANQFKLTISSKDLYGNDRPQTNASPRIVLTVDMPSTSIAPAAGRLEQAENPANPATFTGLNVSASMINQHEVTLDKLYHRSGNHRITYSIDIPTGSDAEMSSGGYVYHVYTPSNDMIERFVISGVPETVTAGTNMTSIELIAYDIAGNVIRGLDTDLQGFTYNWSGPTGTGVQAHTINMGSKEFQNGALTLPSVILRKQETISDFHVMASPIQKRSTAIGSRNVVAATPSKYVLTGLPTNPVAGTPFSLTVSAVDTFGNVNRTWPEDQLTYVLTNDELISSKLTDPVTPHPTIRPSDDSEPLAFNQGQRTLTNAFTLFNSNPTTLAAKRAVKLKVTGTVIAGTANSTALVSDETTMTVEPSTPKYVRIGNSSTYSDAADVTGTSLTIDTAVRPTFFSHIFDQFGNYLGNLTSNWTTSSLNLTLSSTIGGSTQLTTATTANGNITASCAAGANCDTNASVTVNIGTSPLANFTLKYQDETKNTPNPSPTFNAGEVIPLQLCMVDSSGNVINTIVGPTDDPITNPNALLEVTFTSRVSQNDEGASAEYAFDQAFTDRFNTFSQIQSVQFSQGCANIYAKINNRNAAINTALLSAYYTDTKQNKEIGGSGLTVGGINPGSLHRYAVRFANGANYSDGTNRPMVKAAAWADPYTDTRYANNNSGNRFDVVVIARDAFGNTVNGDGSEITLSIVKSNNTSFNPGRTLKCATSEATNCNKGSIPTNQTSVTIPNLAVDFGGQLIYVKATDANNKFSTINQSWLLWPEASFKTVKDYSVSLSSSVFASADTNVRIIARDNYADKIIGADTSLATGPWTWSDSKTSTAMTDLIHSVGGNNPSFGSITFTQGEANINAVFTKAETIRLAVTNSTSNKSSINNADTTIFPGSETKYRVTCALQSDGSDCSGTNNENRFPILASKNNGKFKLRVQALDDYGNSKSGGTVPILLARGTASNLTMSRLESASSTQPQRNASGQIIADTQNTNGLAVIENLYYHVAQPITYSAAGLTTEISTWHDYQSHIDMVKDYVVSGFTDVMAGVQTSFTIQARDAGDNNAAGVSDDLNLLNFSYPNRGAGSGSLSADGPASNKPAFNNSGLSNPVMMTFKVAETITNFIASDNYSSPNRSSLPVSIAVQSAKPNRYVITPSAGGIQPKAGSAFNVTVTARDEFNNNVAGWDDNLTFSWDTAPSVVTINSNTYTPGRYTGATPANGWASGSYTTPADFVIYRSHTTSTDAGDSEKPVLRVTGSKTGSLTATGAELVGTYPFQATLPNNTLSYVRVTTNSSAYSPAEEINGSRNVYADSDGYRYYAYGFDLYGNFKGAAPNAVLTWTGNNDLQNKLTKQLGHEVLLRPTTPGLGTITASCGANCQNYTSGTFTILTGSVSAVAFIQPNSGQAFDITTDQCIPIEVEVRDRANNPVRVESDLTIQFTTNGGNGDFFASEAQCTTAHNSANPVASPTNESLFHSTSTLVSSTGGTGDRVRQAIITAGPSGTPGNSGVTVWYANRSVNSAVQIKAGPSGVNAAVIAANNIRAGEPRRVAITQSSLSINAVNSSSDTCGRIDYTFLDKWGHNSPIISGSSIRFQSNSNTGVFYSDNGCSVAVPSSTRSLVASQAAPLASDTVYYSDTRAVNAQLSILGQLGNGNAQSTLGSVSMIDTKILAATIRPGAFTISAPTAGSEVKNNFTLQWSAAAGVNNYTVIHSPANSTNCTGGTPLTSATNSIAMNNLGSANATVTICIIANGHTNPPAAIPQTINSTSGSAYTVVVDNGAPTVALTAPAASVNRIGPVTTAMGAGADTVFAGTAIDSLSGVNKVEISIRQGTTSGNYFNGTEFTSSSEVWLLSNGTTSWTYTVPDNAFINGQTYTLRMRATDDSANESVPTSKEFIWKNTISTATFGVGTTPAAFSSLTSLSSPGVLVSSSDGLVTHYKHSLVTGSSCATAMYPPSWTAVATRITDSISTQPEGQLTLCVRGRDEAENEQVTATPHTWTKDTAHPSFTLPATPTVNSGYAIDPSVTDADSTLTYSWTVISPTSPNTRGCVTNFSSTNTKSTTISASSCTGSWGLIGARLTVTDRANNSRSQDMTIQWDQQRAYVESITSALSSTSCRVGGCGASPQASIPISIVFTKDSTNWNRNSFTLEVSGSPTINLNIRASDGTTVRTATLTNGTYTNSSGTVTVPATYTIQAGDASRTDASTLSPAGVILDVASATPFNAAASIVDNTGIPGTQIQNSGVPVSANPLALSARSIRIDTTAPTATVALTGVFAGGFVNDDNKSSTNPLSLAATGVNETTLSSTVATRYQLIANGGTCNSSLTSFSSTIPTPSATNMASITEGIYNICIEATDPAGNTGYSVGPNITLDRTAPTFTSINIPLTSVNNTNSGSTADIGNNLISDGANAPTGAVQYAATTSATCDASTPGYSTTMPKINSLTNDGVYFLCVRLADAAGNIRFDRSIGSVDRQTVPAELLPASFRWTGAATNNSNFFLNKDERDLNTGDPILTAAEANKPGVSFAYIIVTSTAACNTANYSSATSTPPTKTHASFATEGSYKACVRMTDAVGNLSYDHAHSGQALTVDVTAPTVTFNRSGAAGDNYVNATEKSGDNALATESAGPADLVASSKRYRIINNSTTCDFMSINGSTRDTLPRSNSSDVGSDGDYKICMMANDTAGNIGYSSSPVITFDTQAPALGTYALAGDAVGGYINDLEKSNTTAIVSYSGGTGSNTAYLVTQTASTASACENLTPYSSTPPINTSLNNDGTYRICLRVGDLALNYTYAVSDAIIRDIVAPSRTSGFDWINAAADRYISQSEKTTPSPDPILSAAVLNGGSAEYAIGTQNLCANLTGYSTTFITMASLGADNTAYRACIKMTDAAGNVDYYSTATLNVDTVAPTFAFATTQPTNRSNTLNLSIRPTSSNTGAMITDKTATDTSKYYYKVISGNDCVNTGTWSGPVAQGTASTVSISDNGSYPEGLVTICGQSEDEAGNRQSNITSATWIKDVTAPAVVNNITPSGLVNTLTSNVSWDSPAWVTGGNPADHHKVELYVASTSNCAAGTIRYSDNNVTGVASTTQSRTLSGLTDDGTYHICMYVSDSAGNRTNLISGSFEVETDTVHFSFTDNSGVKYARYENLIWTSETVSQGVGTYDPRSSLQVDASGNPYVSFRTLNGSTSSVRYNYRSGGNWVEGDSPQSSSSSPDVGLFNELTLNGGDVLLGFIGQSGSASTYGFYFIDPYSTARPATGTSGQFTDVAVTSTASTKFALTAHSGALKISSGGASTTIPTDRLPSNCNVQKVSSVAKSTSVLSVALGCVISTSNSCAVYHGDISWDAGSNTYTAPLSNNWTLVGTIKASSCTTMADELRPSIMVNRLNSNSVAIAWTNLDNNSLNYWSNESGSINNHPILTGTTSISEQSIAIDKAGKSYIVYKDGNDIWVTTNNKRAGFSNTNAWTTTRIIEGGVTGVGTIGITGMRGRGHTTTGQ